MPDRDRQFGFGDYMALNNMKILDYNNLKVLNWQIAHNQLSQKLLPQRVPQGAKAYLFLLDYYFSCLYHTIFTRTNAVDNYFRV